MKIKAIIMYDTNFSSILIKLLKSNLVVGCGVDII